jgi:hypothetical protein
MGKRVIIEEQGREIGFSVTDLSMVFLYVDRTPGQGYMPVPLTAEQARKLGQALLEQADTVDYCEGRTDKEPHPRG